MTAQQEIIDTQVATGGRAQVVLRLADPAATCAYLRAQGLGGMADDIEAQIDGPAIPYLVLPDGSGYSAPGIQDLRDRLFAANRQRDMYRHQLGILQGNVHRLARELLDAMNNFTDTVKDL